MAYEVLAIADAAKRSLAEVAYERIRDRLLMLRHRSPEAVGAGSPGGFLSSEGYFRNVGGGHRSCLHIRDPHPARASCGFPGCAGGDGAGEGAVAGRHA